jgi:DNA polymerase family A
VDVLIDSCVIGSQKNLLVSSDGVMWTDKIPDTAWHFSGNVKKESMKCWDTVLLLNSAKNYPHVAPEYVKMMSVLMKDQVPWSMVLPQSKYKIFFKEIVSYIKNSMDLTTEYYQSSWAPGNKILNAIRPAKTDGARITEIVNCSAMNAQVVESFRPRAGGYASPAIYDRFGTVTGRLVIESGPNILLLKKEYRSIIKPSHPDGKIISIDFASLEARILLYESGNDCPEFDLYGMLAKRFGGMPRDLVKAAVLSVLYGSSKTMVALNLGVSEDKVTKVIQQIEQYIDTRALIKRLKEEYKETGHIKNRFGRQLTVDRPQDNIFVSYYAQSTGVDVSLMGFGNIIDSLGTEGIRPIFVLHDALILDVHPDRLEDVAKVCKVKVPGYDQEFPLKIEEISR